jgi:hypothetical protein
LIGRKTQVSIDLETNIGTTLYFLEELEDDFLLQQSLWQNLLRSLHVECVRRPLP